MIQILLRKLSHQFLLLNYSALREDFGNQSTFLKVSHDKYGTLHYLGKSHTKNPLFQEKQKPLAISRDFQSSIKNRAFCG